MCADTGFVRQFINAFLLDHGGIHIGQQHLFATSVQRLAHKINTQVLNVAPHIPEVFGACLNGEFRRLVSRQPLRGLPTPCVAQRFHECGLQSASFGNQCNDEHEQILWLCAQKPCRASNRNPNRKVSDRLRLRRSHRTVRRNWPVFTVVRSRIAP